MGKESPEAQTDREWKKNKRPFALANGDPSKAACALCERSEYN
ncbi:MAG: hypothetical protein ACR2OT_05030 [Parvibaculales bacterium]